MIATAERYNHHIRHNGVTRRYYHADGTEQVLSYSSVGHTITHHFNNVEVISVEFGDINAARNCWRGIQRRILTADYWYDSSR